jgi:hypothetical protein
MRSSWNSPDKGRAPERRHITGCFHERGGIAARGRCCQAASARRRIFPHTAHSHRHLRVAKPDSWREASRATGVAVAAAPALMLSVARLAERGARLPARYASRQKSCPLGHGNRKGAAVRFAFPAQYYGVIPETPQALSGISIHFRANCEIDPGQATRGASFRGDGVDGAYELRRTGVGQPSGRSPRAWPGYDGEGRAIARSKAGAMLRAAKTFGPRY